MIDISDLVLKIAPCGHIRIVSASSMARHILLAGNPGQDKRAFGVSLRIRFPHDVALLKGRGEDEKESFKWIYF